MKPIRITMRSIKRRKIEVTVLEDGAIGIFSIRLGKTKIPTVDVKYGKGTITTYIAYTPETAVALYLALGAVLKESGIYEENITKVLEINKNNKGRNFTVPSL